MFEDRNSIIIRIRDLRKERSLTQEELAEALGISRQSVNAMEAGRCLPSLPIALQLAQFFDVPIGSIFIGDSEEAGRSVAPWNPFGSMTQLLTRPAVNLTETDTAIAIELRVPGYARSEIDLEAEPRALHVRSEGGSYQLPGYSHREFAPVGFERTIELPAAVNPDLVTAELKHGVLRVFLPKAQPRRNVTTIAIAGE